MTEITKSTEAKKDEMQVEKEKLESVKRADAAVKTMHDFTGQDHDNRYYHGLRDKPHGFLLSFQGYL